MAKIDAPVRLCERNQRYNLILNKVDQLRDDRKMVLLALAEELRRCAGVCGVRCAVWCVVRGVWCEELKCFVERQERGDRAVAARLTRPLIPTGINHQGQSMVNKVFAVSANSGRGIDAIRTYLKDGLPQVLNLNPKLP